MDELPGRGNGDGALLAEAKAHGRILGGFIGLLWLIQIVNAVVFGGALFGLGIHPRSLFGLFGILFAPFLHLSFAHLFANTIPLALLGWFVMLRRKSDLFTVSAISALVGGLGTWLIAPALSVHAGASVLVFGYLGYLLSRGIFERRFWPIVASIGVFFLYGGALWGVLPTAIGVSWQSHLFGLLGGVIAARMMRTPGASTGTAASTPARRRVAERLRVPSAPAERDADHDAEVEAELAQAKERLKARSLR